MAEIEGTSRAHSRLRTRHWHSHHQLPSAVPHVPSPWNPERLAQAVQSGKATFTLELLDLGDHSSSWLPIAEIQVLTPIEQDQEAMKFDPFSNGLGIKPRGYVHFLRAGAYRMSRAARPRHE